MKVRALGGRWPVYGALLMGGLLAACSGRVELAGRSAPGQMAVAPANPAALPAYVTVAERRFEEPGGDGALDGGEQGRLHLVLRNAGPGAAAVALRLTPLGAADGLVFARHTDVGALAAGASRAVEVGIAADWTVADAEREVLVEVVERRSRAVEAFNLSFETRRTEPPAFRVILRDVSDARAIYPGNAPDGLVQAGEMVKVLANVQNVGGDAAEVAVEVAPVDEVRLLRDPLRGGGDGRFALGAMAKGEARDVEFYFFTSPVFAQPAARFAVEIQEAHGRFGRRDTLGIAIGRRVQTQGLMTVAATPRRQGTVDTVQATTVDIEAVPVGSRSQRPQGVAVVIGVEEYRYTFDAAYKHRDAVTFYRYCRQVLGIPAERIQLRTDSEATKAEFDYLFEPLDTPADGWLKKRLKDPEAAGQTDLFVYLAGHGFPDLATGRPYFIPHDVRPEQATNGIDLEALYRTLAGYGARSVTVFVEACFAGGSGYDSSGHERLLAVNMNPVFPVIERPEVAGDMVVFSATSGKKPSNNHDDLRHGIFTYYVLKGLGGEADAGGDGKVTVRELYAYVRREVMAKALEPPLDREQVPQVLPGVEGLGDRGEWVLVEY